MTTQSCKPTNYWLEDLKVHAADEQYLSGGKWLTDSLINAGKTLLRKAYPHIGGLQSKCLGETSSFEIQRGEFVQLLNIAGCHWITASSIGCRPGEVHIYNSMCTFGVPAHTKEQIASILFSQAGELTPPSMQSRNSVEAVTAAFFTGLHHISLCWRESCTSKLHPAFVPGPSPQVPAEKGNHPVPKE